MGSKDRINGIIEALKEIEEDLTVPKNVRSKIKEMIETLEGNIELSLKVNKVLHQLDENDREISYLRFYEQLKVRNIAEVMNMPVGTVKYRLHSIKKKLSNYLEGDNEEKN